MPSLDAAGAPRTRQAWVLLPGLLILALHPASWLASSWFDPGYDSIGGVVFVLTAAIAAWSWSSPRIGAAPAPSWPLALLLGTALIRVAGEILAVRSLGALALVVDVYALATWAGLAHRKRPASPLGLAALFALSLPVERILQRAGGYPLQRISARLACAALEPLHPGLRCEGVLIQLDGAALSVDLPCSGAQGLVLLLVLVAAGAAGRVLRGRRLVWALAWVAPAAILGNAVRLVALAELANAGLDPAAEPLHSAIGLVALAAAALPVQRSFRPAEPTAAIDQGTPAGGVGLRWPRRWVWLGGAAWTFCAGLVLMVPSRPLDVSRSIPPRGLPASLDGWRAERVPLSTREEQYFARYGGGANKAHYHGSSQHLVVVVRTASPLRHLHGPEECLVGAGHRVRLLGVRLTDQTAVYESVDPTGARHRVDVSYLSDQGARASSVAEVIWRWLARPDVPWTMVERVRPWTTCDPDPRACDNFDRALFGALQMEELR